MDTVSQMRVFVRIVECGAFTRAAETFNTSPGAMSRAITELEGRLRTRLLNRSTRKLALTPAGEIYLERCKQILADIERAEEEASDAQQRPTGKLHIHSFAGFGLRYILPAIKAYRTSYPEVVADLTLSQRVPELYEEGIDIAIVSTSSVLPDSDLVSHLLGSSFSVLCASPTYVLERGMPGNLNELAQHECLILHTPAFPAYEWLLESDKGSEAVKISGSVELNTGEAVALAVRSSMGIGTVPVYLALDGLLDGSLVRVLSQYVLQKMNIYALHPSRKYIDARIRTWIEFLRQYLPTVTARDAHLLDEYAASTVNAAECPQA
ncbi:LysR family transcriptional regulator [Paraburkholderia sabiae]|uniref:LysR family transcriptional regulator n=1 Tax=Paraburkholderia sabiae TaxID=273251 RepID=A0ABU9QAH5_9BURK|nr:MULTISPECIES: LysR family transcriptional regulator [Burkholderiaceae]MDR5877760.1 LysR family transcriptional regulator [Caballeronia sp. LZ032]WJZ75467.1 LysR family transcriptional regulator [Paraburkholderia sabiae]CAD6535285.1 HTH-type transcriptional regulator DmlR [Paraburkholderia sabiae]